jgi:cysteine desulfurase/selenocysteine lyase
MTIQPSFDVGRARRETPGCTRVLHFNNAGAALPPESVVDAVVGHLRREAEIGGYEAAEEQAQRLERTYHAIARLLNCHEGEVAVVESATRAWDYAFYSFRLREGDRLLTTQAEYASNFIALRQAASRSGASVEVVPDDETGQVDIGALAGLLDERVRLVSLVHVPTQGGLVQPAAEVGAITRAAGVPLLLDACQSAGQMPLDVETMGCDMLVATGRKFLRGPRGTGFLYVRRGLLDQLEPPFLDLHAAEWLADGSYRIRPDARRFESWETNCATKIGLGVAIDYALEWGLENIRQQVVAFAHELRSRLGELAGVSVHDAGREQCAIVTFTIDGTSALDVARRLKANDMNVSVSLAEYSRLDLGARHLDAVVRASPHYYNDHSELDRFVAAVTAVRDRAHA